MRNTPQQSYNETEAKAKARPKQIVKAKAEKAITATTGITTTATTERHGEDGGEKVKYDPRKIETSIMMYAKATAKLCHVSTRVDELYMPIGISSATSCCSNLKCKIKLQQIHSCSCSDAIVAKKWVTVIVSVEMLWNGRYEVVCATIFPSGCILTTVVDHGVI